MGESLCVRWSAAAAIKRRRPFSPLRGSSQAESDGGRVQRKVVYCCSGLTPSTTSDTSTQAHHPSTSMAAAAIPQPSIFDIIQQGDRAEVQRRVGADPGVVEERHDYWQYTPLMWAIQKGQPAIALWLLQHRGNHDVNVKNGLGWSAIHCASADGPNEIVQQLVAAGADTPATTRSRWTPFMLAASHGHADVVAFLLTLPAVRDSIDNINTDNLTAISLACRYGRTPIVELLLDAGANPTIPEGNLSPLSHATANNHHDIIILLRRAIAESQRPRLLFKCRSIVDATFAIRKAQNDNQGMSEIQQRARMIIASPSFLKGRVGRGGQLPHVVVNEEDEDEEEEEAEKREAVLAYTLGMAFGEKGDGLPREVLVELLESMVPRWDAGARRP